MLFARDIITRDFGGIMDQKREQIAGRILDYLQKHPDAGDTLEGIASWWLGLQQIEISVNEVKDALNDLVEEGVIGMHKAGEGTVIYRISNR
jgi:hypothetical protein